MRIACYQGPERSGSPEANLMQLGRMATEASAKGAQLLVAPEMFLSGYAIGAEAVAQRAEPRDGALLAGAADIARQNGIALIFGFPEKGPDGKVYNGAAAIGAGGELLSVYRKAHLFGDLDRRQFAAGNDEPLLFDVAGVKAGIMICYDVEFPEMARSLALKGAELIVVPTGLMQPYDVIARILVPARAYENQVFVAYTNRCGQEADLDYCGLSCVVGPDGSDLVRAGRGEELIFADLDLESLTRSRQMNPYFTDRRPELYSAVTAEGRPGRAEAAE